jgi:hypothetical protein
MKASPRPPSWPAAALLPLAAVLTCVALAACGSHVTGNNGSITATPAATVSGGSGLCATTQSVQRLSVRRINSLPQNHEHFTFPAHVNVGDPGTARAIAQAACDLPPMPPGGFSCPADWGITYTLTFVAGGTKSPAVTIDATDCQTVRGLGRVRWVARTPAFWNMLGQAMDIPHADAATFRGSMRSDRHPAVPAPVPRPAEQ